MLNDIVQRVMKRDKIPTHQEPTGLWLLNSKRPDGATLIPGQEAKLWRGTLQFQTRMKRLIHNPRLLKSAVNHVQRISAANQCSESVQRISAANQCRKSCSGDEMHQIPET